MFTFNLNFCCNPAANPAIKIKECGRTRTVKKCELLIFNFFKAF